MARTMGLAALRVLQAVAQGKEYGFDVIEATALASGTVYPALSKHERDGYVRSSWEDAEVAHRDGRPPRRYYRLTPQGRKAIDRALAGLGLSAPVRTARARGESS
jgi:DNA-binding PadR family transcriptional regulator